MQSRQVHPKDFGREAVAQIEAQTYSWLVGVRIISLNFFKNVVAATPQDTGQTRANWHMSHGTSAAPQVIEVGGTRSRKPHRGDPPAYGSGKHDPSLPKLPLLGVGGGSFYSMYNPLKHVKYLENGSSDQAPVGMFTLAEQKLHSDFKTLVLPKQGGISGLLSKVKTIFSR